MVRYCRLDYDQAVYATLAPGAMAYFYVDVPTDAGRQSLHIRMERDGGDPVLMASSGQWPAVVLEAVEDMVSSALPNATNLLRTGMPPASTTR